MSSTPLTCPECSSEAILVENFLNICSDCGYVLNDVPISAVVDQRRKGVSCVTSVKLDGTTDEGSSSRTPRLNTCIDFGINTIETVCSNLNISKTIREMSVNFFRKMVAHAEFKYDPHVVKQCLAITALYLVSNHEGEPIAITELCQNIEWNFSNIWSVLLRVEQNFPGAYPEKVKHPELLVPYYVNKLNLELKEKKAVSEYAGELVWMCREAFAVQGYNPIYVVYAGIFYAWKAVDQSRVKVTPRKFFDLMGIELKTRIRYRIGDMYKLLADFARCSPLYSESDVISQNTISLKIASIIRMKRIILQRYHSLNKEPLAVSGKRKRCESTSSETVTPVDPDQDLSDTEIDSYIRNQDEIRQIENVCQQRLQKTSSNTSVQL